MGAQTQTQATVTQLLGELADGRSSAVDRLLPIVYDEMRRLAASYLRREGSDHTLQATALVHEAYLRLVNQTQASWKGSAHFYAVAAMAMRRILIDHAERKRAAKRGGEWNRIALDEAGTPGGTERAVDLLALDEALDALQKLDERQCRIVELRFFGGLGVEDTAAVIGISPRLVEMEWSMARAWLCRRLRIP
jgi:RNA polymerase sigma factor (TIGR02999 family)